MVDATMTVEKSKGEGQLPPATKTVAPDGGWAWMVCLGVGLVILSTRALEPSFGLLFKDLLDELGVQTTGASVICSTLDSVVNFSGFFVGPILKAFSYRKVSLVGSAICALGLLLTVPANSVVHILATYSILGGFGVGLASAATFVALNNFFSKRRGQALGLSMAVAGLGLMLVPQLVRVLLQEYGFRWSVVLLVGLPLHAVLGSIMLQPVKRHLIEVPVDCEMQAIKRMDSIIEHDDENEEKLERNPLVSNENINKPSQDFEINSNWRVNTGLTNVKSRSNMSEAARSRKASVISNISTMDITGSYLQLSLDVGPEDTTKKKFVKNTEPEKEKGFLRKCIDLMDFELLKDFSFFNLLFGLALIWSGELQFRMLMPFFIRSLGYDINDAAFCLSISAIADILVRLILPPIFDKTSIPKRLIVFVAIFFLAVTRSVLAEQTEWVPLMIWLSISGFFRGVCFTNFTLTIAEYCSLENLPAAFGLHMISKGILVVIIGPMIGYVRDYTNSFSTCIHVQNAMIMSCVLVWGVEYALAFTRRRKDMQKSSTTPE